MKRRKRKYRRRRCLVYLLLPCSRPSLAYRYGRSQCCRGSVGCAGLCSLAPRTIQLLRRFDHHRSVVAGVISRQWLASGDRVIFAAKAMSYPYQILATGYSAKTKHTRHVLTADPQHRRVLSLRRFSVSSQRWCVPKPLVMERPPHNYKQSPFSFRTFAQGLRYCVLLHCDGVSSTEIAG